MSISRLKFWVRRTLHNALALWIALWICLGGIPLPLGSRAHTAKDRSQPFPCQDRPCGCRVAAQCWKKCCCSTSQQKVAWAAAHGLTPPPELVAAAARESTDGSITPPKPTCHHAPASSPGERQQSQTDTHFVMLNLLQKCQGLQPLYGWIPWALPAVIDAPSGTWLAVGTMAASPSEQDRDFSWQPPVPPPRSAAPA